MELIEDSAAAWADAGRVFILSRDSFTAAAFSGVPSWKRAPERRWIVYSRPPSVMVGRAVVSSGTTCSCWFQV